jgi:hypothetical protein
MAINIPIISEFSPKGIDKAIKEFQRLESVGAKAQFAIKKAALPAAAALTALAGAAAVSVTAASDLNETISKTEVIFGTASQNVIAFGNSTATSLGISKTAALDAAATFGVFGKAAGLTGNTLATFSTDFTALAADLASFNNTTPEQAINAIGAALRGESEPIRNYGVLLSDAVLKQEAINLGIYDGTGALTAQQKVLAAQAAIYRQTTDAQGDFERTSGGLANQQRILSATLQDTQAAIGQALLPVVQAVLPILNRFAKWASDNPRVFVAIAGTIAAIAVAIMAVNLAMMLNPFTAIAAGIAVLIAGLVIAYKRFETFRKVVDAVLGFIKVQFTRAVNFVKGLLNAYVNAYKAIFNFIVKLWNNTIGRISFKLPDVDSLIDKIRGVSDQTKQLDLEYRDFLDRQTEGTQTWARDMGKSFGDVEETVTSGGAAVETYSQKVKAALGDALTQAKERLKTAADEMAKFGESVKAALLDAFSFRDAAEAGKESGGGFLSGLQAQAKKVTDYASQVQQLLDMGLSKEALQQVLAAGTEAGSAIAAQLIEGGATAIEQTNRLVESARFAADQVGLLAGERYFGAGVKFAQDVVIGLEQELKKLTPKLMAQMDAIAARMKRTVTVDVKVNEIIQRVESRVGGIPRLAEGGVVTRPTLALIGEAGPEAVIPLSRMGQQQQSGGDTTINIYSTIADQSLPDKLVAALRTYNRTTGPIRIQTI